MEALPKTLTQKTKIFLHDVDNEYETMYFFYNNSGIVGRVT